VIALGATLVLLPTPLNLVRLSDFRRWNIRFVWRA